MAMRRIGVENFMLVEKVVERRGVVGSTELVWN